LKDAGAPWVIHKVQQYVAAHPGMNLMVSYPGWHWAQSSRRKHFTFCCVHCGALIASEIFEQLLEDNRCMQSPEYFLGPVTTIPLRTERERLSALVLFESALFLFEPSVGARPTAFNI
jgi:hypothetical protein